MDTLNVLILIFALHFIGDFIFQTREMAENKSKSIYWLTYHVFNYCLPFVPIAFLIGFDVQYIEFLFVLFITHWLTDFFTSKATSYFWKNKKEKLFFSMIGFDQLIHTITLIEIYKYFIHPFVFI
jgi:hypothetical protein